ncbi:flagellar motor switch protein FliM [bacterium]|nr:flagellar motor switch protein FliM [bacterium]
MAKSAKKSDEDWEANVPGGDAPDDEAMAAQWEADLAQSESNALAPQAATAERILNQDEIDSLLGFSLGDEAEDRKNGVHALINSAMVSYERLPMLEVVFDRLVRLMTTSLRNFTSDNVEVSLDAIQSMRFGDYLNSIPLPAILAVFRAKQLDNFGLLTVDSSLIYSIVDVLLGGRRGTVAMRVEGRPYTTIERVLVTRLVEVILSDARKAFDPLTAVDFELDRIETNPRFAAIAQPANAAILVKLRIDMEDRGGRCELLLPYATLEPIRKMLLQSFMGEKFGRDNIWEGHLATELWSSPANLRVVLDDFQSTLGRLLSLQVGETLLMNATPQSRARLMCGDIPLTEGQIGRIGQKVALRVETPIRPEAKKKILEQS